ncbi:hypothetical protein Ddye_026697 [Dipteronia dyeriana]|uniref:Uncharacterized protein n=1 Tax=Dipteronia dyeriana TaxID=168575 RepID=A0AAD9TMN1_9ROSI|nr:hypothetical protein Ddye_026697 [Dipteronia dyeriana]
MEGSSTTSNNINGVKIIFKNKLYICGKKVGVKIYNSKNNPSNANTLFGGSRIQEFTSSVPSSEEKNSYSTVDEEVKVLNAKMNNLETSLNGRMHNLESIQSRLRMMILWKVYKCYFNIDPYTQKSRMGLIIELQVLRNVDLAKLG